MSVATDRAKPKASLVAGAQSLPTRVVAGRRPIRFLLLAAVLGIPPVWAFFHLRAEQPRPGELTTQEPADLSPRADAVTSDRRSEVTQQTGKSTDDLAEAPKDGVVPAQASAHRTLLLSAEEKDILVQVQPDDLGNAIAQAERALISASPGQRDEANRRYLLILNLAAKLAPWPSPSSPELLARQQSYLQAVEVEREELAHLPQRQRDEQLAAFKDEFFKNENTASEPSRKESK